MDQIRWIKTPDCRACAYELRDAPRKKLERIVRERKKSEKCRGCERLKEHIEQIQA